ncbi:hypothetical protein QR680_005922 [Steinernema hermaphroditum]|uniref:Fungal lipase-type domain-containing protein n=1 Tax=Steinernema hermaphroditum TaxID=289476 RepID=A0AA39HV46_9BILA|nr:hypothetical protein QR680_005922 [Steinernema hermaphroditum]
MQLPLFFFFVLVGASGVALRKTSLRAIDYSDELGRNKLMPMSAAAYSDDPSKCVDRIFGAHFSEPPRSVSVKCDFDGDTCAGFATASHQDKAIIIAIRGNEGISQMVATFNGGNFVHEKFPGGGKVSKYFMDAYRNLWDGGLKGAFLYLRNKYPDYQVWVTGHNSGGSLASILAANLVFQQLMSAEDVLLITFGQLRTGNKDYAEAHDRLLPNSFRVVHNRDMIAHLPTLNWEGYYHHGQEIWYQNDMSLTRGDDFVRCKQGESKDCSDSLWITMSGIDNGRYYNTVVSKFGKNGCE